MIHAIIWIFTFSVTSTSQGRWSDFDSCESRSMAAACHRNNRVVDDPNIRETFFKLWRASRPELPMSERREQGGWIVLNEAQKYEVIPFPEEWATSPCSIDMPEPALQKLPAGLVGVVHTHPFFEGEDTSLANVCGKEVGDIYESGTSLEDLLFLLKIAEYRSDYSIKGFVIDGDHVVSMTAWGTMHFYPTDAFFSF